MLSWWLIPSLRACLLHLKLLCLALYTKFYVIKTKVTKSKLSNIRYSYWYLCTTIYPILIFILIPYLQLGDLFDAQLAVLLKFDIHIFQRLHRLHCWCVIANNESKEHGEPKTFDQRCKYIVQRSASVRLCASSMRSEAILVRSVSIGSLSIRSVIFMRGSSFMN